MYSIICIIPILDKISNFWSREATVLENNLGMYHCLTLMLEGSLLLIVIDIIATKLNVGGTSGEMERTEAPTADHGCVSQNEVWGCGRETKTLNYLSLHPLFYYKYIEDLLINIRCSLCIFSLPIHQHFTISHMWSRQGHIFNRPITDESAKSLYI